MKFILLEGHPYDVGYHYNMENTGEMKKDQNYVNPSSISSFSHWKGTLLNEGKEGTEVIMNSGRKIIDWRTPDVLRRVFKEQG